MNVVAGIIYDETNKVLIAQRPSHKPSGSLWEFPGGKVEERESFYDALKRELREEIGIEVLGAFALMNVTFDDGILPIHLHIWHVEAFSGIPYGREGQKVQWVDLQMLRQFEFPKANHSVVETLLANS